jgi:hypothetical protein
LKLPPSFAGSGGGWCGSVSTTAGCDARLPGWRTSATRQIGQVEADPEDSTVRLVSSNLADFPGARPLCAVSGQSQQTQ